MRKNWTRFIPTVPGAAPAATPRRPGLVRWAVACSFVCLMTGAALVYKVRHPEPAPQPTDPPTVTPAELSEIMEEPKPVGDGNDRSISSDPAPAPATQEKGVQDLTVHQVAAPPEKPVLAPPEPPAACAQPMLPTALCGRLRHRADDQGPKYVLEDATGKLLCDAVGNSDICLEKHVGKSVKLIGSLVDNAVTKGPVMTVCEVVEVSEAAPTPLPGAPALTANEAAALVTSAGLGAIALVPRPPEGAPAPAPPPAAATEVVAAPPPPPEQPAATAQHNEGSLPPPAPPVPPAPATGAEGNPPPAVPVPTPPAPAPETPPVPPPTPPAPVAPPDAAPATPSVPPPVANDSPPAPAAPVLPPVPTAPAQEPPVANVAPHADGPPPGPPAPARPAPRPLPNLSAPATKARVPALPPALPLTGTYACNLAKQAETTVPPVVCEQMGKPPVLYVALGPDEQCLWVYTTAALDRLMERLERLPGGEEKVRRCQRLCYSRMVKVDVDDAGRLALPPELVQAAGLKQQLVLIGARDHYELWDAERWEKYCETGAR